ncbi:MAG: hypothetical protein NVSMB55_06360 [Mycobacteriales bacterium]
MTEVWAVAGYDVQCLLGHGAAGQVWRARELATGADVALTRLAPGAEPGAVDALRREASVLRTLATPYLVRLRAVVDAGADTVVVHDYAAGGSLAGLLARRGSLQPGEVVTIAGPLAQSLAVVHAVGLVHAAVRPSNVLFTADGMPLLADLGLARLAGHGGLASGRAADYVDPAVLAGAVPDAASDVWALAAVCHHLLSGSAPSVGDPLDGPLVPAASAPRPLAAAIEAALQADPALRPDAAAFAAALRGSQAAAPVRLVGGSPSTAPRPQSSEMAAVPAARVRLTPAVESRCRPRRLLMGAAAVALLAAAAGSGWLSGRYGELASASAPPVAPGVQSAAPASVAAAKPDWAGELDRLDAARSAAFAGADPAKLAAVYAAASPLLVADRMAVERLRASGRRARGVRHAVRSAAQLSNDGHRAVLRVVDVLAAYDLTDAAGRLLSRTSPRRAATFTVTLITTAGGWRLQSVVPA